MGILFPAQATVASGVELPDGSRSVSQDPTEVKDYFEVEVDPNPTVLEPNFPIYRSGGTRKIKVTVSAKPETPLGNYVIGLDTTGVFANDHNK